VQKVPAKKDFPTLGGGGGGGGGNGGWVPNEGSAEAMAQVERKSGPYCQPPHFADRNSKLMTAIQSAMSKSEFGQFKSASVSFQRGTSTADDYFDSCAKLFHSRTADIFPELVALLPNVEQQCALYAVAVGVETNPKRSTRAGVSKLSQCEHCGQVLKVGNTAEHRANHVTQDFPGLPGGGSSGGSGGGGGSKKKKKKGKGVSVGDWGKGAGSVRTATGQYKDHEKPKVPSWGGQGDSW
jgi:hypothetical protein